MSAPIAVTSSTIPYIRLVLNTEDGQGNPVVNEYRLVYDYRAICLAEESTGIDLKDFRQWENMTSAMTPRLILAGLAKHHSDITLDQITNSLNPGVQRPLQDAMFECLFPGAMEAVKKLQNEENKATSPNAESGAQTANA